MCHLYIYMKQNDVFILNVEIAFKKCNFVKTTDLQNKPMQVYYNTFKSFIKSPCNLYLEILKN